MKINERVKTWVKVTLGTLLFPAMCFLIFFIGRNDKKTEDVVITPRLMNGIDTIRANDSLYVISFAIKKVIPDTIDNESQDKYGYE